VRINWLVVSFSARLKFFLLHHIGMYPDNTTAVTKIWKLFACLCVSVVCSLNRLLMHNWLTSHINSIPVDISVIPTITSTGIQHLRKTASSSSPQTSLSSINQSINQSINPSIHPSIHQPTNQSITSLISPSDITHWMLQIKKCTCNSYNIMFERAHNNSCRVIEWWS